MRGEVVGHYRIESQLGEGGMGVVYKARDLQLDRDVALKLLPRGQTADPRRKARFVREARAASALNHPNIVTIHEIGSADGLDFIVMESVDGKTLDELIPAKGLPVQQALRYAVQMADAFGKAHAAGILHRDIKPSNVMITADDRVKVLDFGLAKLTEPEPSPDVTTMANLTEEGTVVGTPDYMSPEQATGGVVDARSDIFSFGAMLYQMVTGRRPFAADSRVKVFHRVVYEEPVPPSESATIPGELEHIILRALRKDPARRHQSMADLKAALEDVSSGGPNPTASRAVDSSRPHVRWAIALIVLAAAAGFVVWRATRAPRAEVLDAADLTTFSGVESYPTLSPDGNQVAFTWDGPKRDNVDIYVQLIGSGAPLRLTSSAARDINPAWSPDGRSIAFLRGEPSVLKSTTLELILVPPLGGQERKVADVRIRGLDDRPQTFLTWCPDSRCLLVTDSADDRQPEGIHVVSVESGEKRRLTTPRPPNLADSSPAVSPDGRFLVFRRYTAWAAGELQILPISEDMTARGEPRRVVDAAIDALHPSWTPDGKTLLYSSEGALWRVSADGDEPPERIPFVGEDGFMPVVSRGKQPRLVYARAFRDSDIWRAQTTAGTTPTLAPAIASTRWEMHPRLSPDERRVVFTSTRSGHWEIWTSDPDGGNATQVTTMRSRTAGGPIFSPDGRTIAFGSNVTGEFDIYTVPAGGGKPRRWTRHPAFDQGAAFSPDGQSIYFTSNRSGTFQMWAIDLKTGTERQITTKGGWGGIVHGGMLYYLSSPDEITSLWRIPLAGGEETKVLDGVVWWTFWVGDRGITFVDRAGAETRIRFHDFATATASTIAANVGPTHCCITATEDGGTVLFTRMNEPVDDLILVENYR
jgi:serine/threonine protein kinase